ncbi:hypothetical protein TSO221_18990 [Azospirillum sp. TSO22-1]|nr:hypothetical protein TSO221_18990 [Azospirillum sp. TSO22-1]
MTPEREGELFALLSALTETARRIENKVDDLAQRVSRVEGWIEEQSQFLQIALAARQPRRAGGA